MLPLLLTNPALRRNLVGGQPDPLGTGPFWSWYEQLKPAERQQIIAPSLNKLRALSVRPDLRAVLGQTEPRFDLGDLVDMRRVVLVDLAKGDLGPESSALLGRCSSIRSGRPSKVGCGRRLRIVGSSAFM